MCKQVKENNLFNANNNTKKKENIFFLLEFKRENSLYDIYTRPDQF